MKTCIATLLSLFACTAMASDISIKETSLGNVYTNNQGMTLYYFDNDKPDHSVCYDDCEKLWPPLLVTDETTKLSGLTKIQRKDGKIQWAINHQPLYLWSKDQKPGDITGAGVKNIWSIARADNVPVDVYTTEKRKLLTNKAKMTLYTFTKDSDGLSSCNDECAIKWPPLAAQKEDIASAPFSIITRKDGSYQWAYKNKPLYTWIKDQKPGDITGDNVANAWNLVPLP
ncbi:hypothetical protein [Providencia rettgeri]|uniref:hypothetical protein n=1 Tax=Providencia rettgeri TaxID=587 RepID=UPI0020497811|nr:hypothetical protein [Providencia rettgeri]UPS62998.1 hypothetical protein M0M83_00135 [Providencia rettgeri]